MLKPGLVSITFRDLSPERIIELCRENGLEGIEWGGDRHVPHGDLDAAIRIGRLSRDTGIEVVSYGSYYRLGSSEEEGLSFDRVLDTAVALHAPLIRVWAGPEKPLSRYTEQDRSAVCEDARRIAELSRKRGIAIAYEYHRNTMTETNESAKQLLDAARDENILCYWQPPNGAAPEYALEGLGLVLPRLAHLHVFHWLDRQHQFPLADGAHTWKRYLELTSRSEKDHYALLEFVRGDSPDQLAEDARVLREWLGSS